MWDKSYLSPHYTFSTIKIFLLKWTSHSPHSAQGGLVSPRFRTHAFFTSLFPAKSEKHILGWMKSAILFYYTFLHRGISTVGCCWVGNIGVTFHSWLVAVGLWLSPLSLSLSTISSTWAAGTRHPKRPTSAVWPKHIGIGENRERKNDVIDRKLTGWRKKNVMLLRVRLKRGGPHSENCGNWPGLAANLRPNVCLRAHPRPYISSAPSPTLLL